jgi:hypothetical protein
MLGLPVMGVPLVTPLPVAILVFEWAWEQRRTLGRAVTAFSVARS